MFSGQRSLFILLGILVVAAIGAWQWHAQRYMATDRRPVVENGDRTRSGRPEGPDELGQRPQKPRDVLIVTVDTARADRFSYAGPSEVKTPNVDRLASEGTAFLTAVAPVPITLPSHASLFTGRLPFQHGVRSNGVFQLSGDETTLAEILAEQGFQTAAFIAAPVLASEFGLAQGFRTYDDDFEDAASKDGHPFKEHRGEKLVTKALAWLEANRTSKSFVWVHLFDPHHPYDPPEPERSRYQSSPYNGEIAYVDRVVGRLLDGYRELGLYDRSIIVFTSDHGESLGEHDEDTHGMFIYDATVRVPLIVRGGPFPKGIKITHQVGLIDIFPSVLGALSAPVPENVAGTDLMTIVSDTKPVPSDAGVYIETLYPQIHHGWAGYRGLRTDNWKLILGRRTELYDLRNDPFETHDLGSVNQEQRLRLSRLFKQDYPSANEVLAYANQLDKTRRKQLESLGYATEVRDQGTTSAEKLPDTKERIALLRQRDQAFQLFTIGKRDEAVEIMKELVRAEPNNPEFADTLATFYGLQNRLTEALDMTERVIKLSPLNINARMNRAALLIRLGKLDDALEAYTEARDISPQNADVRIRRWKLMRSMEMTQAVREEIRRDLMSNSDDRVAIRFLDALDTAESSSSEKVSDR
jgi:arylsulfatase A-like enzyme